jgi:hypothetical protein
MLEFQNKPDLDNMEKSKRPRFLLALCILSFISIGFSWISSLSAFISGPLNDEQLNFQRIEMAKAIEPFKNSGDNSIEETVATFFRMTEGINENFYAFNLVYLVVIALGFVSVLFMFQGKRMGFHLYIGYGLFNILRYYLFLPAADIISFLVIWELFFAALFTVLYSRNLHWMDQ